MPTTTPTVTINLYVGTILAAHAASARPDILIAADVPDELAKLPPSTPGTRVFLLPLGTKQTINALVREYGTPAQREAYDNRPNARAKDGLAGIAGNGRLAAEYAFDVDATRHFFQVDLPALIAAVPGGQDPDVVVNVYAGMAGGTGALGAPTLVKKILAKLAKRFPLHFNVYCIGGHSFNFPGFHHTTKNTAASVLEWLQVAKMSTDNVSFSLFPREVAPVGKDGLRRNAFLLESQQALESPQIQQAFNTDRSNDASTPLGNIHLLDSQHYRAISTSNVVADVCTEYMSIIESVLAESLSFSLIESIDTKWSEEPIARRSIDEVIEDALDKSIEQTLADIATPHARLKPEIFASLSQQPLVELSNSAPFLTNPISSIQTLREHRILVESLYHHIEELVSELSETRVLVESELEQAEETMEDTLEALLGHRMRSYFRSDEQLVEAAFDDADALRSLADEKNAINAELSVLTSILSQLQRARAHLYQRLDRLLNVLRTGIGSRPVARPPVVDVVSIDEVFSSLWQLSPSQFDELQQVCRDAVSQVTLEGIASITDSDVTIESVVAAVRTRKTAAPPVPWGGDVRNDVDREFVVYPKVYQPLAAELIKEHVRQGDGADQIAFASTAYANPNIVRLRVRRCKRLEDFVTPFVEHGLRLISESDDSALFLSTPNIIEAAGITVLPEERTA